METAGEGGDITRTTQRGFLSHPVTLAGIVIAMFALGFFSFLALNADGASSDSGDSQALTSAPDSTPPSTSPPEPEPEVSLVLDDFTFSATGVVPDEESAAAISEAVATHYGPLGSSDITVDPEVSDALWVEQVPGLVPAVQLLLNGSLTIGPEGTALTGEVPPGGSAEPLIGALQAAGLPTPVASNVEPVDREPLSIEAVATDGVLTLSGTVPSEVLHQSIVGSARASFGNDNVIDDITIDPDTYGLFRTFLFGPTIGALAEGGDFTAGFENDGFFGVLGEATTFGLGNSVLSNSAEQSLDPYAEFLTSVPGIQVTITGHTDNLGPEAINLEVSRARAQSVADYLIEQGVAPSQISVEGVGSAEPAVPNDNDANRAQNRRVVIRFQYAPPTE